MASTSVNDITTSTNLALNEIKDIDKKIDGNIVEVEDLSKGKDLKKRLTSLRDTIMSRAAGSSLAQLLIGKLDETNKKLKNKMTSIKNRNKPFFDDLYEMLLTYLAVLSDTLIFFSPTIIIFTVVLYVLYSKSEYAVFIRGFFQKTFGPSNE
jgi:hypothetical protein